MNECRIGELLFLAYRRFDAYTQLTNVVTTRTGGRSRSPYTSLNLGLHVGDEVRAVKQNRRLVGEALGIDSETFTIPAQIHGAKVAVVGSAERGSGAQAESDSVSDVDAVVTNEADVPLVVLIADCVAVSLYDPKRKVIALAHAGWRGTVASIALRTVETMREHFSCEPADIVAGLSPSIAKGHYEVGEDVLKAFADAFGRQRAMRFLQEDMDGTCYLDLWEANADQLSDAGVAEGNIARVELCTACHPERFYSHRHEHGRTGRFGAVMMMHGKGKRAY